MAATHALGACVERRVGSSPTLSTNVLSRYTRVRVRPRAPNNLWIVSSAVAAAPLHGVGRRFNPYTIHQNRASGRVV